MSCIVEYLKKENITESQKIILSEKHNSIWKELIDSKLFKKFNDKYYLTKVGDNVSKGISKIGEINKRLGVRVVKSSDFDRKITVNVKPLIVGDNLFNSNNIQFQKEITQADTDEVLQKFADDLFNRFKVPFKLITEQEARDLLNTEIDESQITYTDENGNLCAAKGLSTSFTKNGKWELIKEFKGTSHERGGIDISISNGKIFMSGKQGKFEAKYGVVISKNLLK